jgi:hypothetical protein
VSSRSDCNPRLFEAWRKINLYYDKDILLLTCVNAIHTSYCVSKHSVSTAYSQDCLLKVPSPLKLNVSRNNVTTRSYLTENTACLHFKDRCACAACCDDRTKQDKQCMCKGNIDARSRDRFCRGRVIITTFSGFVCVCVCVCVCGGGRLIYPACTAHAPYYIVIWRPVWLYNIFPHCLT